MGAKPKPPPPRAAAQPPGSVVPASRIPRDFSARPESEQAWLLKDTWCDKCGAADLGMRDPHEYTEDGANYVEGLCLRCGGPVRSSIEGATPRQAMEVIFIHGPAASGKHTIASQLSRLTGLPLFHNHLAVDAALSLFEFGTPGFKNMRSAIWRTAFQEAARANRSFIFTFHPKRVSTHN